MLVRLFAIAVLAALAAGCGASTPPPPSPSGPEPEGKGQRASLTAAECEARGGKVVGDIGDGAIHRPDYKCPDTGKAPIGDIVATPGGPVAIEGAVCCG